MVVQDIWCEGNATTIITTKLPMSNMFHHSAITRLLHNAPLLKQKAVTTYLITFKDLTFLFGGPEKSCLSVPYCCWPRQQLNLPSPSHGPNWSVFLWSLVWSSAYPYITHQHCNPTHVNPEHGSSVLLWNVGIQDNMVQQPRWPESKLW